LQEVDDCHAMVGGNEDFFRHDSLLNHEPYCYCDYE
jgi:hypothetical protein